MFVQYAARRTGSVLDLCLENPVSVALIFEKGTGSRIEGAYLPLDLFGRLTEIEACFLLLYFFCIGGPF